MGDAGEGLVDAESRAAERMSEREEERNRRLERNALKIDPELDRKVRSLQLARAELQRQQDQTQNERRKDQIRQALADIDRQLTDAAPRR